MALTNATETVFYMTMNARELRHFFALRLCRRAQKEIRTLARQMLKQLKPVAPLLFGDVDRPCRMTGYCNQGKMGCGLSVTLEEIMKFYQEAKKND